MPGKFSRGRRFLHLGGELACISRFGDETVANDEHGSSSFEISLLTDNLFFPVPQIILQGVIAGSVPFLRKKCQGGSGGTNP
jgi:hypothetical protein